MRRVALLLGVALLATGCHHAVRPDDTFEGTAGFYGQEFEGRKTASGSTFHSEALTCAHRTLPFGTILEVERLDAAAKVRVTVTDRGPFVKGRIIDLSLRAARELGMLQKGLAPVRLRVLRLGPSR